MLVILASLICAVAAVHAMVNDRVAATVFYCFCLHWLRDCFVVVEEGDDEQNQ